MKIEESIKNYLIVCAQKHQQIQKIVLFGSRARGDFNPRSDYDFAIYANSISHSTWAQFRLEIEENIPTLCGVDLLLISDETPIELKQQIQLEGMTIYDATN